MPSLPYWLFPGDDRPPGEIDDEIAEELQLHLDLMAEEQMRQGVGPDEARRQAAERFGDFDSLVRQCRVEKQGDAPMWKRVQTILTALVFVVVLLMGVRQWSSEAATAQYMNQTTKYLSKIDNDLDLVAEAIAASSETDKRSKKTVKTQAAVPKRVTVTGTTKHLGESRLSDVCCLIFWNVITPEGSDMPQTFWAKSDANGRLSSWLSLQGKYVGSVAPTIAAAAPGHCITLIETDRKTVTGSLQLPTNIDLEPTSPTVCRLQDADGNGLIGDVFVKRFEGIDGESFDLNIHQYNETGFESLKKTLDGTFAWRSSVHNCEFVAQSFKPGDVVLFEVRTLDGRWHELTATITPEGEPTVLTLNHSVPSTTTEQDS